MSATGVVGAAAAANTTDTDAQAHDFVRHREWQNAILLYDQILGPTTTTTAATTTTTATSKASKERIIGCLVGRTECYMELQQFDAAAADCRRLLKMLTDTGDVTTTTTTSTTARIRRRLVHALYKLKRFQDAETVCREWIATICQQQPQSSSPPSGGSNPPAADMSKVLERYRTVIQIANGQKSNQRISIQRLDEEMATLDSKLETWATHNLPQDRFSRIATTKQMLPPPINNGTTADVTSNKKDKFENQFQKQIEQIAGLSVGNGDGTGGGGGDSDSTISCTYCSISFADRMELRAHCQTELHQNVIMSDEGMVFFFYFSTTLISMDFLHKYLIFASIFFDYYFCHFFFQFFNDCVKTNFDI